MELAAALVCVEQALADGGALLATTLGGQRTETDARLWRGQVLVDWESDASAGGCLLRPDLLRRLAALHARVTSNRGDMLEMVAPGRIVVALSPEHADLVARLGGAWRVELRIRLRFDHGKYRGGTETYSLVEGANRAPILRLDADVRPQRSTSVAT